MSYTWNLYIFNPLFFVLLLVLWLARLLSTNKHKINYFLLAQIFCIWLALAVLAKNDFNMQFSIFLFGTAKFSKWYDLIFLGTGLYCIVLIVPLVWLFNKFQKKEIYDSATAGAGFVLAFVQIFVHSLGFAIAASVGYGFVLAVAISYFMQINRAFNNQFSPWRTILLVSPLVLFGILAGNNINWIFYHANNHQSTSSYYTNIHIVSCLAFAGALVMSGFSFKKIKYTNYEFDLEEVKIFEQFTWSKTILLAGVGILLICIKSLSQNDLFRFYIASLSYHQNSNLNQVHQNVVLNNSLFLIAQLIGGFMVGNIIIRKIGFVRSIFLLLIIAIISYFAEIFTTNNVQLLLFFVFVNGFLFGALMNLFLCLLLMWNNRQKSNLVFPVQISMIMFFQYTISTTFLVLNYLHIGVFSNALYNNLIVAVDRVTDLQDVVFIIAGFCGACFILIFLIFYYKPSIIAEYINPSLNLIPKHNKVLALRVKRAGLIE